MLCLFRSLSSFNLINKKSNLNVVVSTVSYFLAIFINNSILEGGQTKLLDGQTSPTSRLTKFMVEQTILIIYSKKIELKRDRVSSTHLFAVFIF